MSEAKESSPRSRCPSRQELADFSAGKIAQVAADAICAHLADCSQCRAILEECDGDVDPVIENLRDSFRNSPVDAAKIGRLASQIESIRESGCEASVSPADTEIRSQSQAAESTPQIRCPYCHEVSSLDDGTGEAGAVCPKCHGKFGLALDEDDDGEMQPGCRIAHYQLVELLGKGSFGTVWKARDTILHRQVALKLPRKGNLRRRNIEVFLREARLAAQVHHPGIVSVHEVGGEKDTAYIASELIEGRSLDVALAEHRYSVNEAATICLAITEAIGAAHASGLVHRDLKPANIILDKAGCPHIADFGLAHHSVSDVLVTVEGRILGTPVYMCPEQASGRVDAIDARSDIYSLGVVLYELLTGRPPFDGDVHILVSRILLEDPVPPRILNPTLPRDLETICLKCLEKKANRRYQSAEELAGDLQLYLEGKPIHARPISSFGRLWRWARRKPALAAASLTALTLLMTTIIALAVGHWRAEQALQSARKSLYFHSITSANERWLANDPEAVEAILEECPEGLRDFEWGYMKQLVRTPVRRIRKASGTIAYDPTGNKLATGCATEKSVRIWNGQTDELICRMFGHSDFILSFAFHPDGVLLASAGQEDKSVRLWDTSLGWKVRVLEGHRQSVNWCAFSPDGANVLSADNKALINVWDIASGEVLHSTPYHKRQVRDIVFSPTARRFAVGSLRGAESDLSIYDYDTEELITEIPTFNASVGKLAYSADGTRLAVGEIRRAIRVWQVEPALSLLATFPGPASEKCQVAFDRTGRRIAAETLDGAIRVWDVTRVRTLAKLRGHTRPVGCIAFSPDGEHLAASCGENEVCIWDITAEQGSVRYEGGSLSVYCLATSSDGRYVAAGLGDGTVKIWERATGKQKYLFYENSEPVWSVAFSPDGKLLAFASEDTSVRVYEIASGQMLHQFMEHTRPLRCVAFSRDGELIASSGVDRRILVWETQTGRVRHTFRMRGPSIRSLAFHPDGRRLAGPALAPM